MNVNVLLYSPFPWIYVTYSVCGQELNMEILTLSFTRVLNVASYTHTTSVLFKSHQINSWIFLNAIY